MAAAPASIASRALEHQGQPGGRAQPGDVVPRRRAIERAAAEDGAFPGPRHRARHGAHAPQVDGLDIRRQAEAQPLFAVAHAVDGRIHRDHQRAIAGGLGAPDQPQGVVALALEIELEPQRRFGRARHVLESDTRLRAGHHHRLHGGCRQHAGQFALWVDQFLVGHRGEQDGEGQRRAQQLESGAAARQVAQHAGLYAYARVGLAVGAQRVFVGRAARQVGPGGIAHALSRVVLVVGHGGDLRGDLRQGRQGHVGSGRPLRSATIAATGCDRCPSTGPRHRCPELPATAAGWPCPCGTAFRAGFRRPPGSAPRRRPRHGRRE